MLADTPESCVQDGWAERHQHAREMHPDGANFPSATGSCFLNPDFIIRCQREHSLPQARALLDPLSITMRNTVTDRCLASGWITADEARQIRAWYANPEDPVDAEHPAALIVPQRAVHLVDPQKPAHPVDPEYPAHPEDPQHQANPADPQHPWTCGTCTFHNDTGSVICGVCEALAPGVWQCPMCTLVVHEQGTENPCPSCGHLRTRKRKPADNQL
jgi:hypothetical protein